MSKLQAFLCKPEDFDKVVEVEVGGYFNEDGTPATFKLKKLDTKTINKINNVCLTTDKNGKPKLDIRKNNNEIMLATIVEPNLHDEQLLKMWDVIQAVDVLEKMFDYGDYNNLLLKVLELNGISDKQKQEEIEEAKN